MPPFITDEGEKYLVPFVSLKILGKPGFEISGAVEAEFSIPKRSFLNDDFFNFGK
jgi:hypothetical protein